MITKRELPTDRVVLSTAALLGVTVVAAAHPLPVRLLKALPGPEGLLMELTQVEAFLISGIAGHSLRAFTAKCCVAENDTVQEGGPRALPENPGSQDLGIWKMCRTSLTQETPKLF